MTGTPTDTAIGVRPLALPSPNQEPMRMTDSHHGEIQPGSPAGLNFLQALALCDGGDVADQINKAWNEVVRELVNLDQYEGMRKSKASLSIKATIEYEDGTARLKVETSSKVPNAPKRASMFWIGADGRLCQDNPKQLRMFADAPRRPVIVE